MPRHEILLWATLLRQHWLSQFGDFHHVRKNFRALCFLCHSTAILRWVNFPQFCFMSIVTYYADLVKDMALNCAE